mmetsp:Transcript_46405/g.115084  ORF Transcript_46405/g.115084 Transcript_46405/m.115084 type:complete len:207 (+) Transcript_46405:323-943(+)
MTSLAICFRRMKTSAIKTSLLFSSISLRFLTLASSSAFTSRLKSRLSSLKPIAPEPSASNESKSLSTWSAGASSPISGRARRNSFLSTAPLPSSSHSRKRSMTRTAFAVSVSRSCLWMSTSSCSCMACELSSAAILLLLNQRTTRVSSSLEMLPDLSTSSISNRKSSTVASNSKPDLAHACWKSSFEIEPLPVLSQVWKSSRRFSD